MARYFFDIHNGQMHPDTEGHECASLEEVRLEAMHTLPKLAKCHVPVDGDWQAFTTLVRDEDKNLIYTVTLTYAGVWLGAPEVGLINERL